MGYFLQPAIHTCVVSINSWDSPFLLSLNFSFSIRKARLCHYHRLKSRSVLLAVWGSGNTDIILAPRMPLSSLPGAASSQFLARSTSHHSRATDGKG